MTINEQMTVTQFRVVRWAFQTDHDDLIVRVDGVPAGVADVQLFNVLDRRIGGESIQFALSEAEASVLETKFAARRAAYTTATGWTHFPPPAPEGE